MMIVLPAPFSLRPLQLADLTAVSAIEQLSLPTPTKTSTYQHELTNNQMAHYHALCAAPGAGSPQNLIGYSGYWHMADEAHISIIAVHPDWRCRGLGELLLLNLLAHAVQRGIGIATLEVRRSNVIAQSLYLKYSFEIVGERRRYYANKEDALLMTAVLENVDLPEKQNTLFARPAIPILRFKKRFSKLPEPVNLLNP